MSEAKSNASIASARCCSGCGGMGCDDCMWEGTEEAKRRLSEAKAECMKIANAMYGWAMMNAVVSHGEKGVKHGSAP